MSQQAMSQSQTVDDAMSQTVDDDHAMTQSQTVDENTDENKLNEVVRDKWTRIHQQYSTNNEHLVFYQIYCTEKTVEQFETGAKQNETTKSDGSHLYEVAYTQTVSSVIRVTKTYLEGGVESFCLKNILGNNPGLCKFYDAFGPVNLIIYNSTGRQFYVKTKNIQNMRGVSITFDDENILRLERMLSGQCVCLNHAGDQSVLTCKIFTRCDKTSTVTHDRLVEDMFARELPSGSQELQTLSDPQDEPADAGNTQDESADAGNTQDEAVDAGNTQDESADAGNTQDESADAGNTQVEPADAGTNEEVSVKEVRNTKEFLKCNEQDFQEANQKVTEMETFLDNLKKKNPSLANEDTMKSGWKSGKRAIFQNMQMKRQELKEAQEIRDKMANYLEFVVKPDDNRDGLEANKTNEAEATAPKTTEAETTTPKTNEAEATAPKTTEAETTTPKTNEAETTAPPEPVVIHPPTKRRRGVQYVSTETGSPTKKAATSEAGKEGTPSPAKPTRVKQTDRKK